EVVRRRIVTLPHPDRRDGQICGHVILRLGRYLEVHDVGHPTNGGGVIIERDPDTVRGADIASYSYNPTPKGPRGDDSGEQAPKLVVEVRFAERPPAPGWFVGHKGLRVRPATSSPTGTGPVHSPRPDRRSPPARCPPMLRMVRMVRLVRSGGNTAEH